MAKDNSLKKVICDYCGKTLEKHPSRIKSTKKNFCNKNCYDNFQRQESQKLYKEVVCSNCGKVFKKLKNNIAKNQKLFFCSRECNFNYKSLHNEYVIMNNGEYAKIIIYSINKKEEVLIDVEDIEKCKKYIWCIKTLNYVRNKQVGLLHRFIVDCPKDKVVDHINNNPLDNRKNNLRICTILQNNHNKKNKKEDVGVYQVANGKYIVRLFYKGKIINLGTFVDKQEAINVRKKYKFRN